MMFRKASLLCLLIFAVFCTGDEVDLNSHFWQHIQKMPLFTPPDHDDEIQFADFLFEQGLYDDAITEYSRYLYENKYNNSSDYALFQKALCYLKLNDQVKTRGVFNELAYNAVNYENAFKARIIIALHYIANGDIKRGKFELYELARVAPDDKQGLIMYFNGWVNLIEGDIELAGKDFACSFRDTLTPRDYQKSAYEIHRWFNSENPSIPEKSPELAAFASGIIPGSGQMYSGNFTDGLNSLVINAGCGFLTISSFVDSRYIQGAYALYFIWKRYYLGGIKNAEKSAIEFNKNARDEITAALMDAFFVERK